MRPFLPLVLLVALAAAAALLLVAPAAQAATTVPAQTIVASTTWTLEGSPYVVTGTVTVAGASDPVLTVEPGVEVRFTGAGSLVVGSGAQPGTLVANGTAASPVAFRSSAASPAAGDWTGLRFQGPATSGPSYVSHAVVEHAGRASRSSVEIVGHPVLLDNATVRAGAWAGVFVDAASPALRNVTIRDHAQWGLYAEPDARPALQGLVISGVGSAPLRVRLDQDLGGVTLEGNALRRVELHGMDVTASRTLSLPSDALTGEGYEGLILTSFTIRNGATWTLEPGARLLVAPWSAIHVGTFAQGGNLRAEGTEAEPIAIAAQTGSAASGWYGLYFRGDSAPLGTSVLRNVTLAHSRDDAIEAYRYDGLALDNVTLSGNARHALRLDGSEPSLRNVQALDSGREGVAIVSSSAAWNGGAILRSGLSGVLTAGCGVATLRDVEIGGAGGNGLYADGACNGAHLDNVTIRDVAGRAWRNRLDLRYDARVHNASVAETEYWGSTLTGDRTLAPFVDLETGVTLTPVVLSGFEIRSGATLTIPPNATVLFDDWSWINVGTYAQKGSVRAEGTQAEPIRLLGRGGPAGWQGLYFRGDAAPPGESVLRNVTIAHSRDDAIDVYRYSGLVAENLTLEDNGRYGIRLDGASLALRDLHVRRSGWESAYWHGAAPLLERAVLEQSGRSGVYTSGCGVATLRDVTIRDARGYGYFADNACNGAHFDGVVIENVTGRPWRNRLDARLDVVVSNAAIAEVEHWGVTLVADATLAPFQDAATGARLTPVVLTGVEVRSGATLTIPANATVLFEEWSWINVGTYAQKGSLRAEGTQAEPIRLLGRSGSVANGWYGLYFRGDAAPPGESVLRNVTIAHSRDDAIEGYYYGALLLDNVTLEGHARHGVLYSGGAPQLRNVVVSGGGGDGARFSYSAATWRGGLVDRAGGDGVSTTGCGVITLADVVVSAPVGYGFHADGACNGAHLDGVTFEDVARPWRNRLDARADARILGSRVDEAEYWGNDVTTNRTLPRAIDEADGARLADVLLSGFTIRNDATFTVHAGATVLAEEWAAVKVGTYAQRGSLRAEGTRAEPIVFAARSGAATHGWSGIDLRGDWAPQSATVLRNATVASSREYGIETYHYRGFELDNVTIERNAWAGLRAYGSGPGPALVRASLVQRNGADGIHAEQTTLALHGSNVSRNGANGVEIVYGGTTRIENTTFFENGRSGVNLTQGSPALAIRRNIFWQNGGYGVDLHGASGSLLVDNAFMHNEAGQARATGLHTWNLTRAEGRNVADGAFLGGNAWSDYEGADEDGDGLGETAYARGLGPGADRHPVIGGILADFRASVPDVANAPQTLIFEPETRGGLSLPTRWHWSFGDGAESDARDPLHAFPADGTYAVTLRVWNDLGQTAAVTKDVFVDSSAPTTSADLDGTIGLDGWYVSAPRVTISGADEGGGVAAIRWRLDGGAFTNYVGPFLVWEEGEHVLEHHAIDASGNVGPASSVAFRVDRMAPVVDLDILNGTAGRGGWYVSDVLVALNASGGPSGLASLTYAFDGGTNGTYDGPLPVTEDGVHTLRYEARDAAGNVAEGAFTVLRDTTLPEVLGNESGLVGGSGWYVGRVRVNLTGEDAASGVIHLNASVDGGAWFEVTGPFEIEGEGVHTLNVTATDAAGNHLVVPARSVRVEASTPVATVRLDAVAARDGWHRAEPDATVADAWLPLPAVEGSPEGLLGPLPATPATAATEPALAEAWRAWQRAVAAMLGATLGPPAP